MVFEFESHGARHNIETSALGIGSIVVLPNGKPMKVTGWKKKIPREPVVEDAADAPMSDSPEATAALNKGSVLAQLIE